MYEKFKVIRLVKTICFVFTGAWKLNFKRLKYPSFTWVDRSPTELTGYFTFPSGWLRYVNVISVWICNDINGSTCQECYYNEVDGESGRRKKIAKIILLSESPMSPGRLKMEWVGSFCFIIIFILLYMCVSGVHFLGLFIHSILNPLPY